MSGLEGLAGDARAQSRPNNRLQRMRGRACFRPEDGYRGGPAPLTLVSLGRWAIIAAAAGDPSTPVACVHLQRQAAHSSPARRVGRCPLLKQQWLLDRKASSFNRKGRAMATTMYFEEIVVDQGGKHSMELELGRSSYYPEDSIYITVD